MAPAWHGATDPSRSKFETCAEDDPNRCQAVISIGQCHYKAMPGSLHCIRHGGAKDQKKAEKKEVSNFRLLKWQARLEELRSHSSVKSLRDEIGISRIVLESILNKCKDEHDLLMHHSQINQSVLSLEKLIKSCQQLEERNSYLLDKDQLYIIVDSITQIISEYVTDPDKLNEIGAKIYGTITTSASESDEGEFTA